MNAEMVGELVKIPESLREPAELMVGELTSGFFPLGLDVALAKPNEHLNGLWVQREIFNALLRREKVA